MVIELSNLTFTNQDDVIPALGVEEILNTGTANTLAGNDRITGAKEITIDTPFQNRFGSIFNSGTLNTADGNDIITGIINRRETPYVAPYEDYPSYLFYQKYYSAYACGIYNVGSIYTGEGNDRITGVNEAVSSVGSGSDYGIYSEGGTIETGGGNDIITGITQRGMGIKSLNTTINTGDGSDTITGTSRDYAGIYLDGTGGLNTGADNDIITGTSSLYGLFNYFDTFVNTGEGNDTITGNSTSYGRGLSNYGFMDTGAGNDIITGRNIDEADGILDNGGTGLLNGGEFDGFMYTGDGNDTITGINTAKNGIGLSNSYTYTIDTGNGNDFVIGSGTEVGILNMGTINTGNGNDSIIANGGFDLNIYGGDIGQVFLGNGQDYLEGFGNGSFNGGNGQDTLRLTPGSYTVEISAETVNFTQPSSSPYSNRRVVMITSEFEKLIAGSTIYNFTSLTDGQIITIA
jgi:hypothetical protein